MFENNSVWISDVLVEGQVTFYFDIKDILQILKISVNISKFTKTFLTCWLVVNEFISNFDQKTLYKPVNWLDCSSISFDSLSSEAMFSHFTISLKTLAATLL